MAKRRVNRANELTKAIVKHLILNGFYVWRENTTGVWDTTKKIFRKNPLTQKGIPDVIGFRKADGMFVGIEVKIGKDRLSPFQKEFLCQLMTAGGIGLVVKSIDEYLVQIEQYIPKKS